MVKRRMLLSSNLLDCYIKTGLKAGFFMSKQTKCID